MTNREFEIFVERSRTKLLAIAHQYLSVTADAEDVVQEALLKLYAMRQRLDTYHSVDALAVVVVKRLALNVLRHEQRHHETTLDERITSYEEPPSEERYIELLEKCYINNIRDWGTVKSRVRDGLSRHLYEQTGRSPMILPVILEV